MDVYLVKVFSGTDTCQRVANKNFKVKSSFAFLVDKVTIMRGGSQANKHELLGFLEHPYWRKGEILENRWHCISCIVKFIINAVR